MGKKSFLKQIKKHIENNKEFWYNLNINKDKHEHRSRKNRRSPTND